MLLVLVLKVTIGGCNFNYASGIGVKGYHWGGEGDIEIVIMFMELG